MHAHTVYPTRAQQCLSWAHLSSIWAASELKPVNQLSSVTIKWHTQAEQVLLKHIPTHIFLVINAPPPSMCRSVLAHTVEQRAAKVSFFFSVSKDFLSRLPVAMYSRRLWCYCKCTFLQQDRNNVATQSKAFADMTVNAPECSRTPYWPSIINDLFVNLKDKSD